MAKTDEGKGAVTEPFQESAKLIPGTFRGPIDIKTKQLLDKIENGTDQFTCPHCESRREYITYSFRANVNGEGIQDIELHRCSVCSAAFFDPEQFMASKK